MRRSTGATAMILVLSLLCARNACAEELSHYSGAQLYQRFCASCHGTGAKGDGPVAPFFKLSPPDLTRIAERHGGQYPAEKVHQIIDGRTKVGQHGTRSMPVWGLEFMQADAASGGSGRAQPIIARLVEYLRSIQGT